MKITTKIRIYSILSWILLGLTFLLAVVYQLAYMVKMGRIHIFGFLTEILFQPYFWVALILRWRIKMNKLKQA